MSEPSEKQERVDESMELILGLKTLGIPMNRLMTSKKLLNTNRIKSYVKKLGGKVVTGYNCGPENMALMIRLASEMGKEKVVKCLKKRVPSFSYSSWPSPESEDGVDKKKEDLIMNCCIILNK